jgi:hypothetical protein
MANATEIDNKLKERLNAVNGFYAGSKRMPTYSEMTSLFGVKSKNAVFKIVNKFIKLGFLNKDSKGFLLPLAQPPMNNRFLKLLGSIEAGFPSCVLQNKFPTFATQIPYPLPGDFFKLVC